ncbi:MAG: replication restart helicase PriA [Bacilli bacterium]
MYAKIIVDIPTSIMNEEFDYIIPEHFEKFIDIGSRVLVAFGHQETMGFVVAINDTTDYKGELKEILDVLDLDASLTKEQLELAKKMSFELNVSVAICLNMMLPAFLKGKYKRYIRVINEKQVDEKLIEAFNTKSKVLVTKDLMKEFPNIKDEVKKGNISFEYETQQYKGRPRQKRFNISPQHSSLVQLSPKKTECLNYLKLHKDALLEEICDYANCSADLVLKLEKDGLITSFTKEEETLEKSQIEISYDFNQSQLKSKWERVENKPTLLFTNDNEFRLDFCLDICQEKIKKNKRTMFIVPTILACEELEIFLKARLKGYRIVSFNSSIPKKEFYDNYIDLKNDLVDIVIATRVGIFFPINNLGLIVMLNEEEGNYINDYAPNFDTKNIIEFRAEYNKAKILYVTSTPLVETYYKSVMGKYTLLEYHKELDSDYKIINMKDEILSNNKIISRQLLDKLKECLLYKKQALLVLNNKGYSSLLTCRSCGKVVRCPKCNIPLVLYKEKGHAQCSYCNYKETNYEKCRHCDSETINILGFGLEQVREKLIEQFPQARILQIDSDNLKAYDDIREALLAIEEGNVDFILGTNVLTKMLKNNNIHVVGILNVDNILNMSDYNSSFLVYSLIANCAIRYTGALYVQTSYEDNKIIKDSCLADYSNFFNEELKIRRMLNYPPFSELNRIYIRSEYKKMYMFANSFKKRFFELIEGEKDCLGPVYVNRYKSVQLILKHNDPVGLNSLYKQMYQRSLELKVDLVFEKNPKVFR